MAEDKPSKVVLDPPPQPDGGLDDSIKDLFSDDDSVAAMAAKFALNEALLNLLTRDLKFADFSREIILAAMSVVKSEAGSIFEVDHGNNVLFFRACVGQSADQVANFTVPMGAGIVGHVAESRQPVCVSDLEKNDLHLKTLSDAVGFEAYNLVAVPLIIRGQVYGVLELLNRVGQDDYTDFDMEILEYFAAMASRAIEIRLMIAWASEERSRRDSAEAA